jgi:hypothetical protein
MITINKVRPASLALAQAQGSILWNGEGFFHDDHSDRQMKKASLWASRSDNHISNRETNYQMEIMSKIHTVSPTY